MQAYGEAFAQVYNLLWANFARDIAPRILDFYAATEIASSQQTLLDLCCGTGQLALYFLERGYRVTGIDLSEPMLDCARANTSMFVQAGQARFVQGDASSYTLDTPVGLAVSSFDALNHLPSLDALRDCFACTHAATVPGGTFIFDLNTRAGLQRWNNINVTDTADLVVINRGIYDGGERAYTRISGFVRIDDQARYTRFDELVYNTVYDLAAVYDLLLQTGWQKVSFARGSDLSTSLAEPEHEGRIFVIASR